MIESPAHAPTLPAAVLPLRFTAAPAAMIAFLRTLGMAASVSAGDDAFAVLRAGAGQVMVHGVAGAQSAAQHGDTDLCLAVPSAQEAARRLERIGVATRVWDETYGKQGIAEAPGGGSVALNEPQEDLYGYEGPDASVPDARLRVVAVLSSEDVDRDAAYFEALGFHGEDPGSEHFRALRGSGQAGTIGLHSPAGEDAGEMRRTRATGGEFGDSLQVTLGFETTEDLEELAARLRGAGYDAHLIEPAAVHVVDPDGCPLQIHPLPS